MRYVIALLIPVAFAILGFGILAGLFALAENWSRSSQQNLLAVINWWAQYWWVLTIILGALCFIGATVSDALGSPKSRRRG